MSEVNSHTVLLIFLVIMIKDYSVANKVGKVLFLFIPYTSVISVDQVNNGLEDILYT